MEAADIVIYLQNRFAGQLVLYVPDMAKILGKSDRAVDALISRKTLPFTVKLLGGRRCVDIFQVAQFLSSTPGAAEEVAQSASDVEPHPRSRMPSTSIEAQSVSPTGSMTPLAQKLLAMRHDHARAVGRYAAGLLDDEHAFLQGVAEELRGRGPQYTVTTTGGSSIGRREDASSKKLPGYYILLDAEVELLHLLTDARYAPPKGPVTYSLRDGENTLFRCVVDGCKFSVDVNELQLELQGL